MFLQSLFAKAYPSTSSGCVDPAVTRSLRGKGGINTVGTTPTSSTNKISLEDAPSALLTYDKKILVKMLIEVVVSLRAAEKEREKLNGKVDKLKDIKSQFIEQSNLLKEMQDSYLKQAKKLQKLSRIAEKVSS